MGVNHGINHYTGNIIQCFHVCVKSLQVCGKTFINCINHHLCGDSVQRQQWSGSLLVPYAVCSGGRSLCPWDTITRAGLRWALRSLLTKTFCHYLILIVYYQSWFVWSMQSELSNGSGHLSCWILYCFSKNWWKNPEACWDVCVLKTYLYRKATYEWIGREQKCSVAVMWDGSSELPYLSPCPSYQSAKPCCHLSCYCEGRIYWLLMERNKSKVGN